MTLNQSGKTATVFGGTGFLGRYVVQALTRAGYEVRIPTRAAARANRLRVSGVVGQVVPITANIKDDATVHRLVEGAQVVVNLVGILAENRRQKFPAVHTDLPERIAKASAAAGVEKLVHISAIGADKNSKAAYARSKALGEEAILAAFPNATILRPSVVFGPEDEFLNRFGEMAMLAPALPLIGGGHTRFQPVYVGDVADAVMAAITRREAAGQTYELGGPRRYSLKQILDYINEETGRHRRLVNLPFGVAKLQGAVFERLPGQMLTRDQVELLKSDNVVADDAKTLADLDIEATTLEVIAPTYLYRFRKGGRFAPRKAAGTTTEAATSDS
ncbi:MAG: complex I NDUFA9 subunit family protein [Alphaproteobacteria bacterium]|nr:complex I NDUFA9 subunit family protein [Alphaproteobacteria bacterium SS10]